MDSGLYVVSTPIGNLRDITLRAVDVLKGVSIILAEDTRVSGKLLVAHGVSTPLSPYHEHNADIAGPRALRALADGAAVALISDAGTPLVSDPGYKLVRAAIDAGHRVIPIPGPSAALAALVVSGLPSDRFLFMGFPPTRSAARRTMFQEAAGVRASLIFYETGPRLAESLADMSAVFGARPAAIARELTKLYEETRRAPLPELAAAAALGAPPRGEIVIVVGPPAAAEGPDADAIDEALRAALADMSVSDAAERVSADLGVARKKVYARALALKARD
jgi:16S rRNA (cytidine1402-2'-O)-methyltransferase